MASTNNSVDSQVRSDPRVSEFSRKSVNAGLREFEKDGGHATIAEITAWKMGAIWGATEMLNYAMQLCGTGMPIGMIRKLLHNKMVEITGEGERA